MDQQDEETSPDKRERSESMQTEQTQPVEPLEKDKISASTAAAAEHPESRHQSSDIGTVDDIVTGLGGRGSASAHSAHTTRCREYGRAGRGRSSHEGFGGEAVVTMPATVIEQNGSTKVDAGESMRFMMKIRRDQISCNKNFAHVWPRWSKTCDILEVSRLVHLSDMQVVDFDMCTWVP